MKVISHTLDTVEPVTIIPLADTHIGDANCDMDKVRKAIAMVTESPNTYAILDGDLMNTAIAGSRSDVYHETMTPTEQLKECVDLFDGMAKAGRILAVLPGNHEERISRAAGVDMTKLFCLQLGIENCYSPTSALIFLRFGANADHGKKYKLVYTIYANHGRGGVRRPGGKINALEDFARIVTADVYLAGHTHQPACFRNVHYVPNPGNCTLSKREQVFVNTASFLTYDGSYADRQAYSPASNVVPMIQLGARNHEVKVTI